MPRRRTTSPDALLERALALIDVELVRLRKCQRASKYLTESDQRHLVRLTSCLREVEADRQRPWDPRKLARMTDHEIDEAIRRDRETAERERQAQDGN